jgi:hypothetical protein
MRMSEGSQPSPQPPPQHFKVPQPYALSQLRTLPAKPRTSCLLKTTQGKLTHGRTKSKYYCPPYLPLTVRATRGQSRLQGPATSASLIFPSVFPGLISCSAYLPSSQTETNPTGPPDICMRRRISNLAMARCINEARTFRTGNVTFPWRSVTFFSAQL